MLVLSRNVGESIVIGEDVVITVLMVSGATVRLGIEAPRDIVVHRAEVVTARAAAQAGPVPSGDSSPLPESNRVADADDPSPTT